jgi:predicted nuclease of predicted toxin-antitoxin system
VRFLVDAQLPPLLARRLVELGHEAWHVADFAMERSADREIWNKAAELDVVLITKDADFVTLRASRHEGPAVVWVRIGNTTRHILLRRIEGALAEIVAALQRGEHIVVVA